MMAMTKLVHVVLVLCIHICMLANIWTMNVLMRHACGTVSCA